MNYNSYNDQYQTTTTTTTNTSYGAQGGAAGGGFMNQYGSQSGSQNTPSKTYGKDTVRPVTIRQLLNAQQPHPDAEFKVDGTEVTQFTFIGQIRNISTQAAYITYKLDDGTAIIEVKLWNDSDNSSMMDDQRQSKSGLVEGAYARVWGRMRAYNDKRTVGAHAVRRIDDLNEIQYHLLEATVVHLYFIRGPPPNSSAGKQDGQAGGGQGQAGDDYSAGGGGGMSNGGGGHQMGRTLPHMSASARRVYEVLRTCPQNNEGLHIQNIAARTGLPVNEVHKAGEELQNQSLIFQTVDDETWATLEA